jgi:hypothetical protein
MPRTILVGIFVFTFLTTSVDAQSSTEFIKSWLAENSVSVEERGGKYLLFSRRRPVRAWVRYLEPSLEAEVKALIESLANAYGITVEFTSAEPNLMVFAVKNLADGDKLNPALPKLLGFDDRLTAIVEKSRGWSSGCGGLHFSRDGGGEVGMSMVIGDRQKLASQDLRGCTLTGVIRAFGIPLRHDLNAINKTGLAPYVLMARLIHSCRSTAETTEAVASKELLLQAYANCVLSKI